MSAQLPVARPDLGPEEAQAVARVLATGWITQGPEVARFEDELAAFVGAPHAVAVANCTVALHLALLAVGVRPGDEVIVPSHSFIATANAVRHAGAVPVFADVALETLNLDAADVARRIGPRTRAVMVVHQLGIPADLPALQALCERHGLTLLEDAACAIGSQVLREGRWERIGAPHSRVACFSFHPRKLLTTGDGGMLTTSDPALAESCRRMRQHGMSIPDTVRHRAERVVFEEYGAPGFNYRLTDLQAAVGRVQLQKLPALVARRRELAARYRQALAGQEERVLLLAEPAHARWNYQSFYARLGPACRRPLVEVMEELLAAGISTRRGVMCSHLEPAYAGTPRAGLERSELLRDRGLILPLFGAMRDEDVDRVAAALLAAAR